MDDVGGTSSQPDPAAGGPLSQTCYRLLVRLAALLTGDAQLAEIVAATSCGAVLQAAVLSADGGEALSRLQREIVLQSRRAVRQRPAPGRHSRGIAS